MTYEFKLAPELGWALLTAIVAVAAELLFNFDVEEVLSDPAAYGSAAVAAVARSVGATLLNFLRKSA